MRELINDEEYASRKKGLTDRIVVLKQKAVETQDTGHNWLKHTEEVFNFAYTAKAKFEDPETSLEEKKGILMDLGGNHTIKDEELYILPCIWLEPIEKKRKAVEKEINRSELRKTFAIKGQNTRLGVLCPVLRGLVDEVRTAVMLYDTR
jgi:hypothetical protein